jgi:hypothetical protein
MRYEDIRVNIHRNYNQRAPPDARGDRGEYHSHRRIRLRND